MSRTSVRVDAGKDEGFAFGGAAEIAATDSRCGAAALARAGSGGGVFILSGGGIGLGTRARGIAGIAAALSSSSNISGGMELGSDARTSSMPSGIVIPRVWSIAILVSRARARPGMRRRRVVKDRTDLGDVTLVRVEEHDSSAPSRTLKGRRRARHQTNDARDFTGAHRCAMGEREPSVSGEISVRVRNRQERRVHRMHVEMRRGHA